MQPTKLQTEDSEGSESRLLNFLTARGVSVEDRSKRTATVRPQWGEHSGQQPESDSALSATSDESGVELGGETDDGIR